MRQGGGKKGLRRVASEPERLDICVMEKTNCREMQRTVDICVENTAEKPQRCKKNQITESWVGSWSEASDGYA